jgi:hypothetical protein
MKGLRCIVAISVFVLGMYLSSETLLAETVNGVSFDCRATARTNLADTTVASDVDSIVTNNAGERMTMRYHFIVISDQNRTFDAGPGGKQLASGSVERHQYTPFGKVSPQDEFPAKCLFTKVQVCPTAIPANWPKGPGAPYFDPFRNGPVAGCRNSVDLEPTLIAHKQQSKANTWTDQSTGLMWAHNDHGDGALEWQQARSYCQSLTLGGYSGWRLPEIDELKQIYDATQNVTGSNYGQVKMYHIKGSIQLTSDAVWSNTAGPYDGEVRRFFFSDGSSDHLNVLGNPTPVGSALCLRIAAE